MTKYCCCMKLGRTIWDKYGTIIKVTYFLLFHWYDFESLYHFLGSIISHLLSEINVIFFCETSVLYLDGRFTWCESKTQRQRLSVAGCRQHWHHPAALCLKHWRSKLLKNQAINEQMWFKCTVAHSKTLSYKIRECLLKINNQNSQKLD